MRTTRLFLLILGLALTVRLALALTYEPMWGVDGGASLLTVNAVLGDEPTGAGFPKPPLAPGWTLVPFVLAAGPDIGYKLWSAIFALLPIIPLYLLTRQIAGQKAALFAALFASVDWMWGEMFVTGSHPLVAFALLGMAFWAMNRLYVWWNWKSAITLALSVGLIPWVNQTTAGLALIVLPVYWLGLFAWSFARYKQGNWQYGPKLNNLLWHIWPPAFVGAVIALSALPWYMQTLPGSEILTYQGPTIYWAWGMNTVQAFLIALPLGAFAIWKAREVSVKALALVLIVLGVMVNFMSYDEVLINPPYRARYLMTLAFYPLASWTVWNYALPKVQTKLAWGLGLVAFLYVGIVFLHVVRLQNEYSLMVTPQTSEALDWLRENDPQQGVATNSFTLSLWVAGLNKVHSPFAFTAPPPPAYVDDYNNLRCLYNWVEGCDPGRAALQLGVRYLLIEERFPYYNDRAPGNYLAPLDQWQRVAEAPWLKLEYEKGTTKLWQISADGEDSKLISNERAQSPRK